MSAQWQVGTINIVIVLAWEHCQGNMQLKKKTIFTLIQFKYQYMLSLERL